MIVVLLLGFLPVMAAPGEETSQLTDLSLIQLEQRLSEIDDELATLATFSMRGASGTIGYRSKPARRNLSKWLQITLDETCPIDEVVLVPVIHRTEQNGLQADGFPQAFRVILGTPEKPEGTVVAEYSDKQTLLPRIAPLSISCKGTKAAWIRIEVDRLSASELNDRYVLQLAEIMAFSGHENVALHQAVSAKENRSDGLVWDKDFLVDGFVPYLMDAASGQKSRPFVSIINKEVHPVLTIDLESPLPLSRLHLHTIEKDDFIPQSFTSDFAVPRRVRVEGASQPDFHDARTLLELDLSNLYDTSPIMMWRFPEADCRYVKLDLTDLRANPFEKNTLRFGFAEIELFSHGKNVALAKSVSMNATISPEDLRRPLSHLTDGRNVYGSILPIRDWMRQLHRRHELETERPSILAELSRRYARQRQNLTRMKWLAVLLAAGIGLIILINRLLRMREVARIKERFAADLHDELGANLHTIGLLSDLAEQAREKPQELSMLHQRMRAVTEQTRTAMQHCMAMQEASGLYAGLETDMERAAQRIMAKLEHDITIEGEACLRQLKARTRMDLFLFYKECLVNISRHSGATQFTTHLQAGPREIHLSVSDNGHGIGGSQGNGIPSSLKRRARLLGAKVTVDSPTTGGTRISLKLKTGSWRLRK